MRILLLIGALVPVGCASSAAVVSTGPLENSKDCRVLSGKEWTLVQGGCKVGLAEGLGLATKEGDMNLVSLDEYRGEFKAGRLSGDGVLSASDHSYCGEFRRGQKNGVGAVEWLMRLRYIGDWKDDKPHGRGAMIFEDGAVYYGDFLNGEASGSGMFWWKSGVMYKGRVNELWPMGQGVIYTKDNGPLFGTFDGKRGVVCVNRGRMGADSAVGVFSLKCLMDGGGEECKLPEEKGGECQ